MTVESALELALQGKDSDHSGTYTMVFKDGGDGAGSQIVWNSTSMLEYKENMFQYGLAALTTYGTKTMNFGDKPAAAISSIALRETAEIYKNIDEVAAKKDDSFVDDIATGDEDEQVEARLNKIKEILSKGGFHVKGAVRSGDKSEENLQLLGTCEIGRVLGVGWDPTTTICHYHYHNQLKMGVLLRVVFPPLSKNLSNLHER